METLEDYLAQNEGGHILDIACGSGNFTKRLITHFKSYTSVTGLDIKPNLKDDFLKNIDGQQVTFVASPFATYLKSASTFDTVSISNALHHLENVQDMLAQFKSLLNTNGSVIINEMYSDNLSPAQESQRDLHSFMADLQRLSGEYHRGPFSTKEIYDMIHKAGLHIQHTFKMTNDDAPTKVGPEAANTYAERIQTALEKAYGQNPPTDVMNQFEYLKTRATQVGVGSPPQLTFVCSVQ